MASLVEWTLINRFTLVKFLGDSRSSYSVSYTLGKHGFHLIKSLVKFTLTFLLLFFEKK